MVVLYRINAIELCEISQSTSFGSYWIFDASTNRISSVKLDAPIIGSVLNDSIVAGIDALGNIWMGKLGKKVEKKMTIQYIQ